MAPALPRIKHVSLMVQRGRSPEYSEEPTPLPVVNQAVVQDGYLDLSRLKYHANQTIRGAKGVIKPGDILVCSTGGGMIGRCAQFQSAEFHLADGHVAILRANAKKVHPRYLYYFLKQHDMQRQLEEVYAQGSTNQLELSPAALGNLRVPLPPLAKQQAIVNRLDREIPQIEALRQEKAQLLKLFEEKRDAIVEQAVGGSEWTTTRLKHVLVEVSKPCHVEPERMYQEIGVRSWGRGVFPKEKAPGFVLGDKDVYWVQPNSLIFNIVFAWEGAVALVTESESGFIVSHRFPMFQPRSNRCSVTYLNLFFQTRYGRALLDFNSPGAAGRNRTLSLPRLLAERIRLPPVDVQKQIVDRVKIQLERLAAQQQLVEQSIAVLAEKRQALITAAVSGELGIGGNAS